MKKVLILVFNDLRHDARVMRQINFLMETCTLTVACFDAPENSSFEVIRVKKIKPTILVKIFGGAFLLLRLHHLAYKILYDFPALRAMLKPRAFDIIIANDIESLPLAWVLRKREKIIFDAHEYAPRHFEDKRVWRIFFQPFNRYLCKTYLPRTDAMTTVGEGLAKEYAAHYPVQPIVLTNANYYYDLKPRPVSDSVIKLIHHGAANPSRQLELMLDMLQHLDRRFTLDLMLLTPSIANKKTRAYLDSLKERIKKDDRIRILDPVKSHEVVPFIHHYDIGIFLLPPVNFNYANTLPNKLFDFIQARLAIAIGPTPEMARVVNTYSVGVVSEAFTAKSMAQTLTNLTAENIMQFKNNADAAAKTLSADNNKKILNDLVTQLLM